MKKGLLILKYFAVALIFLVVLPYLVCPFYEYPENLPFGGNQFFNPYEKIDSSAWRKANFHAHSRQWLGLTAGSTNHPKEVAERYGELGYNIIGISDYQSINSFLETEPEYIPIYEHGYNVIKGHQLVIGAQSVCWYDFMLFQSFHNMQDVICSLKKNDEAISLNHPKLRNAYSPDEIKYLRDYDLLEIANHSYFNALDIWDMVLSNGNPVFAIANDDNHDIKDPEDFGYAYNLINSPLPAKTEIISALKSGRSVAVELEPQKDSSPQNKVRQAKEIPFLVSCRVDNNILRMRFDKNFDTLKLIGQNGIVKKTAYSGDSVSYIIATTDTYIRCEINQGDKSNIFLNPVIRYNGELIKNRAEIDFEKTWIFRSIYIIIFTATIIIYFKNMK